MLGSPAVYGGEDVTDVERPERTVSRLARSGIVIREIPTMDAVRASVHAVNTEQEIDELADALLTEW